MGVAASYLPRCGEYALRAMAYLAAEAGRNAIARDIAEATQVPLNYLQKILSQLARNGLLRAQRGLGGGFSLGRPAELISMHDVFQAVDAQVERIVRCPLGRPEHAALCPLHHRLDQAYAMIDQLFRTTSLASLVGTDGRDGSRILECGMCPAHAIAVRPARPLGSADSKTGGAATDGSGQVDRPGSGASPHAPPG